MLILEDLVDYLILKKAYDGKEMRAFRSLYGKNYVDSKWLGDIYDCKVGELHFFKASVSPSQPGVGRADYKSWAVVSDSGIVTGHCTCPAGAGRSCSHISAVLYAVIMAWEYGIAGERCTDKARVWGRGASNVLQCHEEFEEIVKDNTIKKTTCNDKVKKQEQFLTHSDLSEFVNKSTVKSLWECKGSMLNRILTAPEKTLHEKEPLQHGCHDISNPQSPCLPACTPCKEFFDKFVQIGERNISMLKEATSEQTSTLWLDSRKLRITASKIHSVPKTARANPDKYVTNHIYNRFKGSVATKHGNKYEPVARKWFEDTSGLSVTKSGIVVRSDEQYLAASPDGVIDENTILEIKCPTKSLQSLLNSGKYDVCLKENGEAFLNKKGKNGYYSQVQMTMYCTKTSLCKFVVWTEADQLVVDVPYDQHFMDSILPRVRAFYFKHLLVRLADEHHFSRLELAPAYRELCE